MPNKTLAQLYAEHVGKVSDKWSFYFNEYERILDNYRDRPIRLLEIGIQNGGSLEIWSKYFPNAQKLVGCDINPDCARLNYEDPRIAVVVGDANSDAALAAILGHAPAFDMVIDDGSHRSSDVVKSFARYFPNVADGGVFIAEDLHCSYWQEFEGGLFDPFSSMTFFKRLADVVSHEHWGIKKACTDILRGFFSKYGFQMEAEALQHIHSVEFINSMCVIRKAKPERNRLGARIIAGSVGMVVPGDVLRSSPEEIPDQTGNKWTARSMPPDEELLLRIKELTDRDGQIATLNQTVTERDGQIAGLDKTVHDKDVHIRNLDHALRAREEQIGNLSRAAAAIRASTSWRLTRPVRFVGRQLLRIKIVLKALPYALSMCGGYGGLIKHVWSTYKDEGISGIKRRVLFSASAGAPPSVIDYAHPNHNDYSGRVVTDDFEASAPPAPVLEEQAYLEFVRRTTLTSGQLRALTAESARMEHKPLFSIVAPTFNVEARWLRGMIESVLAQAYPLWELCIADDASTQPHVREVLEEYRQRDVRIKVVYREQNGHISDSSNTAMTLATGDFYCLLDNDDEIAPNALYEFARLLNQDPSLDMIYSDEDKVSISGKRYEPFFKPDWSPDYLESAMYTAHFACYRKAIADEIGGFRRECNGAQDYDFVLRFTEKTHRIAHVPKVLYHWRAIPGSTASSMGDKTYVLGAAIRALEDRLQRTGRIGTARVSRYPGCFDVRTQLERTPLVSIVIPTAGRDANVRGQTTDLLANCLSTIRAKSSYKNFEIVVVDNGDLRPQTLAAAEAARCVRTTFHGAFNLAKKVNQGAALATGEFLLILNDDIEVISPDWIEALLEQALKSGVGVVGAKLLYEDGTLQHVGVTFCNGLPDHIRKHFAHDEPGYFFSTTSVRNYLAVTGACMLTPKALFDRVGGFSDDFPINYNDIDYCLKCVEAGHRVTYTPHAELSHFESVSRKAKVAQKEIDTFLTRWSHRARRDPYYNEAALDAHPPNFALRALPEHEE